MDNKFEAIRPFNDEEASVALKRVSENQLLKQIHSYIFPEGNFEEFKNKLASINSVKEFQEDVMAKVLTRLLDNTVTELTYSGINNIDKTSSYLFLSNHRDIILDSGIIQLIFYRLNLMTVETAAGDNLISVQLASDLIRSNRMLRVVRGGTVKEKYSNSLLLSSYIREKISKDNISIWLAQANGRAKDGRDITEQGLLKMLDMSGQKTFIENFSELSIIPLSVSYEYEPCDFLKARETYLTAKNGFYNKKEGEDVNSILIGITQFKGRVHISFDKAILMSDIDYCGEFDKNGKFKELGKYIDSKICASYHLWPNNYIAHDILFQTEKHSNKYTNEEKSKFLDYMNGGLEHLCEEEGIDINEVKTYFLRIYANPVLSAFSGN